MKKQKQKQKQWKLTCSLADPRDQLGDRGSEIEAVVWVVIVRKNRKGFFWDDLEVRVCVRSVCCVGQKLDTHDCVIINTTHTCDPAHLRQWIRSFCFFVLRF